MSPGRFNETAIQTKAPFGPKKRQTRDYGSFNKTVARKRIHSENGSNDTQDVYTCPRSVLKGLSCVSLTLTTTSVGEFMLQADRWIRKMALEHGMIEPFVDRQMRQTEANKMVSFGLSSYGYDLRVADEFKVFTNVYNSIVDPKEFREDSFVNFKGVSTCIIPPNSFALARSVEYFRIPRNVLALCIGKSTYARCGIIVNVTPFEPEWEGTVTLEISNTTPLPAKIYAGEGLAQVLFLEAKDACEVSYADRKGKYMKQLEITCPRI